MGIATCTYKLMSMALYMLADSNTRGMANEGIRRWALAECTIIFLQSEFASHLEFFYKAGRP